MQPNILQVGNTGDANKDSNTWNINSKYNINMTCDDNHKLNNIKDLRNSRGVSKIWDVFGT